MSPSVSPIGKVKIVYFSGTGGTARVADCFEKIFLEHGMNVEKYEINTGMNPVEKTEKGELLLLLYAVHALNAPEPVHEWIERTSRVEGIPAAVISVSGGGEVSPNTACRVGSINRLKKKGYDVIYEQMLIMPSNVAVKVHDEIAVRLLKILPSKVERIVGDLLSGIGRRNNPLLMDRALSAFGELEKIGARWFGQMIKTNDSCNGCGWCERNCPRANIRLEDGRPSFGRRCVFCLRCIYGCPSHALKPGVIKFAVLKDGYDLKSIENLPEIEDPAPVEKLAKGYLWKGVRDYLLNRE